MTTFQFTGSSLDVMYRTDLLSNFIHESQRFTVLAVEGLSDAEITDKAMLYRQETYDVAAFKAFADDKNYTLKALINGDNTDILVNAGFIVPSPKQVGAVLTATYNKVTKLFTLTAFGVNGGAPLAAEITNIDIFGTNTAGAGIITLYSGDGVPVDPETEITIANVLEITKVIVTVTFTGAVVGYYYPQVTITNV